MELIEDGEPVPEWYDIRVAARSDGLRWLIVPMGFNYRLISIPEIGACPVHGWCYDGPLSALSALKLWDPDTENEPLGWHKRAGRVRRAPRRHLNRQYNRPRCEHGTYDREPQCPSDAWCPMFRRS